MEKFENIMKEIRQAVEVLAGTTVRKYKSEALADAKKLLSSIQDDLKRWTKLLTSGGITTAEYEWLIASYKEEAKMKSLEKAGLAISRIRQFANSVLDTAVDVIFQKVLEKK